MLNEITIERALTYEESCETMDSMKYHLRSAQAKAAEAVEHIAEFRRLAVYLYEGSGWIAMEYPSWRACMAEHFGKSAAAAYRELVAALTELNLSVDHMTITGTLPATHAAALHMVEDKYQAEVLRLAEELTPPGHKVTATRLRAVVDTVAEWRRTGKGSLRGEAVAIDAIVQEAEGFYKSENVASHEAPKLIDSVVYVIGITDDGKLALSSDDGTVVDMYKHLLESGPVETRLVVKGQITP